MTSRDPYTLMWAEALGMLDRADRLRGRFFQPGAPTGKPVWEPPADVFETDTGLFILVALPGVAPDAVHILIDGGALTIAAQRPISCADSARLRRLEIPHGRFERHIDLPPGLYELVERSWENGCLKLCLRRLS